jgi:hypothetical protein
VKIIRLITTAVAIVATAAIGITSAPTASALPNYTLDKFGKWAHRRGTGRGSADHRFARLNTATFNDGPVSGCGSVRRLLQSRRGGPIPGRHRRGAVHATGLGPRGGAASCRTRSKVGPVGMEPRARSSPTVASILAMERSSMLRLSRAVDTDAAVGCIDTIGTAAVAVSRCDRCAALLRGRRRPAGSPRACDHGAAFGPCGRGR